MATLSEQGSESDIDEKQACFQSWISKRPRFPGPIKIRSRKNGCHIIRNYCQIWPPSSPTTFVIPKILQYYMLTSPPIFLAPPSTKNSGSCPGLYAVSGFASVLDQTKSGTLKKYCNRFPFCLVWINPRHFPPYILKFAVNITFTLFLKSKW